MVNNPLVTSMFKNNHLLKMLEDMLEEAQREAPQEGEAAGHNENSTPFAGKEESTSENFPSAT